MAWLPTDSDDVVKVACPLALSVPVPSTVAPSLNVTVPVGEAPVTVAVNVTDCSNLLGFSDEVSVTVVCAIVVCGTVVPTVRVADVVFDKPPSAITVTVLFFVPVVVPFTLTEKVQEAPAASVAPERETALLPAVAVIVPPPHDPVRPLGVETTSPAGKLSVNPIPVSDIVLAVGLVIVNVRALVPLREIEEGVKVLEIVGGEGATTVTVAVLLVPNPTRIGIADAP